jgi:hypothetical protein
MNVFQVSDPEEIKALSNDPAIDRQFNTRTCPFNWFLLKRSLSVLSFEGRRFPTMTSRRCMARERYQDDLWRKLTSDSADIQTGPTELAPIAAWIRGTGSDDEVGILAQQLLGRLFKSDFTATAESWNAAKVLVAAPRSPDLPRVFWWFVTGKVSRAKRLLAGTVDKDLSAVNAIGIAVHNVVKGLRQMRTFYADLGVRSALSAEAAASRCLFAPVSLYRQSTGPGQIGGCPFPTNSLFVFNIGEASRMPGGQDLVFMDESWSRCPASQWVPALLKGVWKRATVLESREKPAKRSGFEERISAT